MPIELSLSRQDPLPLYHQIVQAIRWRIGSGTLGPGDVLPPVREAAEKWQVNYHTVRRAYQELVSDGLVETVRGAGTRVAPAAPLGDQPKFRGEFDRWVDHVVATAGDHFGISARELASAVLERARHLRVVMVECTAHQCDFLAEQLERDWGVEAIPWPIDADESPPDLPIIGTYFHHAEMRSRWPDRVGDMHFVALYLDPGLEERVERASARRNARVLRLVERDSATAREMAAGVSALVSSRFVVEPTVGHPADVLRELPDDQLLLVAPRLWHLLDRSAQADERLVDVRHVIVPEDLQRVRRAIARTGAAGSRR